MDVILSRVAIGGVVLALLLSPAGSRAASLTNIESTCPDAAREAAEMRARTNVPHEHGTPARPALRADLLLMAAQDQDARAFLSTSNGVFDPQGPEAAWMRYVDSANLKRLKHIVHQDGFPTARMVGLDGVHAAWLLAVHAGRDPDFQEKILALTKAHLRRGEVRSDQVAMLTDDLLAGRGKPQRYGTNFEFRDGELRPAPMEDEANVDKRRSAVGLGSLANYTCVIRAAYGSRGPVTPSP